MRIAFRCPLFSQIPRRRTPSTDFTSHFCQGIPYSACLRRTPLDGACLYFHFNKSRSAKSTPNTTVGNKSLEGLNIFVLQTIKPISHTSAVLGLGCQKSPNLLVNIDL